MSKVRQLAVWLPVEEHKQFKLEAVKRGVSMSDVLRPVIVATSRLLRLQGSAMPDAMLVITSSAANVAVNEAREKVRLTAEEAWTQAGLLWAAQQGGADHEQPTEC